MNSIDWVKALTPLAKGSMRDLALSTFNGYCIAGASARKVMIGTKSKTLLPQGFDAIKTIVIDEIEFNVWSVQEECQSYMKNPTSIVNDKQ